MRSPRRVEGGVAAVLLLAATLKGYQLSSGATPIIPGFFHTPILLALWLLIGGRCDFANHCLTW